MRHQLEEVISAQIKLEVEESQRRLLSIVRASGFEDSVFVYEECEGASLFLSRLKNAPAHGLLQKISLEGLKKVFQFYVRHGKPKPWFFVSPHGLEASVFKDLAKRSYYTKEIKNVLFYDLKNESLEKNESSFINGNFSIRVVKSDLEMAEVGQLYSDVKGVSQEAFETQIRPWLWERPNSKLYAAWLGNELAGIGLLSTNPQAAMLSSGAVRSQFQGQGVQRALITARLRAARELRLSSAFAPHVSALSTSEANLRRVGFEILYPRAVMHPAESS